MDKDAPPRVRDDNTGRVTASAEAEADRASADAEADRDADRTSADGDADRARLALRRLAGDDDAMVVRRAAAAVDDLDAAATFVEEVGLDRLEVAVEAVQEPTLRAQGSRALAEFERFRAAAAGDLEPGDLTEPPEDLTEPPEDLAEPPEDLTEPPEDLAEPVADHFRRGRGTDLRGDGQSSPR